MKKLSPFLTPLVLFFLACGQLTRLSFLNQEVNIYLYEVVILLHLTVLIWLYQSQPWRKMSEVTKAAVFFLGALSVTWVVSVNRYSQVENLISFLYLGRLWMYFLYLIYLWQWSVQIKEKKHFQIGVIAFISITIVSSFAQYFLYPDLRNLQYLGWDPHLYRMFGLYFDPPIAAGIYGLALIYIIFRPFTNKWLTKLTQLLLLIMLFFTYSRGALLALFVGGVIFAIQKKAYIPLIVFVVIFIGSLMLLPKTFGEGVNLLRTSTISSRMVDYQEGITIWQKQPLLGIGYNHIRPEKVKLTHDTQLASSHAGASFHSSFLVILVTGGVFTLFLFMYFLGRIMQLSQFAFYSGLYLSVISLTDNVLLNSFVLSLWFIFLTQTNHLSDSSQ